MTLLDTIVEFMKGQKDATATLKQINDGVCKSDYVSKGKTLDCSIRAIIYRHKDTFKRIGKGIYLLKGEKTSSLLINGDSREWQKICWRMKPLYQLKHLKNIIRQKNQLSCMSI